MALMKFLRGGEESLANQPLHDGYIWFCKDTGSMYIDHKDESNTLVRSKISAEYADKLRYVKNGETVELTVEEIKDLDVAVLAAAQEYTDTEIAKINTNINTGQMSVVSSSYIGIGSGSRTLTFDSKPYVFFIKGKVCYRGFNTIDLGGEYSYFATISWGDDSITITATGLSIDRIDELGVEYPYVVITQKEAV